MAKATIPFAKERLIYCRLCIDIFREFTAHLPEWYEVAGAEAYLVSSAVLIGHIEGRPMTASDVANVTGLPRTTVIRKLNLLMAAGIIERKGSKYCLSKKNIGRTVQVEKLTRIILESAKALSNLDTKPVH